MRYIESLLALYEEKNISKASQKLFISQQGLSRQIQSLEKELGVLLFVRSQQGVIPTEICTKLHPEFIQMYKTYSQVKTLIQHHKITPAKPVTIAFAYGISHGLNTEVILRFQKEHPTIHFQIKEWPKKKCIDKLLLNEVDIALLVTPIDSKQYDAHLLAEGYMYIAIHKDHPLSSFEEIPFSLLDEQTILTGAEDNALRELFDYYCATLHIHPNILFSSSYSLDIINSTTDHMMMATVTPIMAEKITNPDIKVLRLLTPEPGYLYCCTSKTKRKSKEVDNMVHYIIDYFKHTPIIKLSQ
jgi:DNA-binding transcriptional LysR family regulator